MLIAQSQSCALSGRGHLAVTVPVAHRHRLISIALPGQKDDFVIYNGAGSVSDLIINHES
jgi:hypothetical protein